MKISKYTNYPYSELVFCDVFLSEQIQTNNQPSYMTARSQLIPQSDYGFNPSQVPTYDHSHNQSILFMFDLYSFLLRLVFQLVTMFFRNCIFQGWCRFTPTCCFPWRRELLINWSFQGSGRLNGFYLSIFSELRLFTWALLLYGSPLDHNVEAMPM